MSGLPQPVPQSDYNAARRLGRTIHLSGRAPRRDCVLQAQGPVRVGVPLKDHRAALELSYSNVLVAARGLLAFGETLVGILSLTGFAAVGIGARGGVRGAAAQKCPH